ncbi:MAG: helix-turn-helix domain-containing protein [Moheibacter sp.]
MIEVKDEKYLKIFGEFLRKLRNERGMSQEKLANNAGVSISQITRIENATINPTLCTIKALAKGLGVKTAVLFEFENELDS